MAVGRELILSAGAVHSPLLLQASGVGPAALLQSLGLSVVLDQPAVGRHLQDHLCIDHLYRARVPTLNQQLRPWSGRLRAALRYLATRRGPMSLSVNQGGGFVRSMPGAAQPDLQLYFSPLSYHPRRTGQARADEPGPVPRLPAQRPALLAGQPRPCAAASAEPGALPLIVPNSLSAPQDLNALVEGSRWLRRLAATPALAAVIDRELEPGAARQSQEELEDDIRQRASSVFHPVGSCRMGSDSRQAVVDARLRVHGLAGLRIIDASIFPHITSGNTNAPAMMVAEKGADLVLADAHGDRS